jgi:hypothetical protein
MADQEQGQKWNPVDEARQSYPALKDWSDARILNNLSDPTKFKSAFPQYAHLGDDVIKRNISALQESHLTANDENEGTYEMVAPHGGKIKIPYGKISDAATSGYKMSDTDRKRYLTDAAADKSLSDGKNLPEGVQVIGKNSAGQDIVGPVGTAPGTLLDNFTKSELGAVGGAVKGVLKFLNPNPNEEEIKRGETGTYDTIMRYPNRLVQPQVDMARQADEEAAAGNASAAAEHRIASVIPVVGPFAASLIDQTGAQIANRDYGGAAGTVVGNAMVAEAPGMAGKVVGKTASALRDATPIRSGVEALTRTGPRELKQLAEETHQKNLKVAQDHLEASQAAAEETRGKELDHGVSEKEANETAHAEHQEKVATVKAKNQKAVEAHNAEVAAAKAHNDAVIAKHEKAANRIKEENSAAEHALELRRNTEANLQKDTDQYYKKEDRVKEEVRKKANDAWKPWHDKMDNVLVPETELSEPIKKVTDVSPDARRALKQLIPDREDLEAGPTAQDAWMKQRDEMAEQKLGPGKDYRDASPMRQSEIDDEMRTKHGEMPQVSAIDLENPQGARIEQIHRARSIINRNVAKGVYEGQLHGEMMQVSKNLGEIIDRYTRENGAEGDLKAGNKATKEYHEAFGRERHVPKTGEEIRKQQANPEQFKEDDDQERLKAAAVHDPSLVKDFEAVKKQRDLLKKMKTEDELRKSLRQVPAPPTVGDFRNGYALKPEPEAPITTRRDAQGNLHQFKDGKWIPAPETGIRHQLEVEPAEPVLTVRGVDGQMQRLRDGKWEPIPSPRPKELNSPTPESVQLERPNRAEQPDRTPDQKADLAADRKQQVKEAADRLRARGIARSENALFYTVPSAIITAFLGHLGVGLAESLTAPVILLGSQALAKLMESPSVTRWISNVTPKDVAVWEKLPPEQQELFTENIKNIAQVAKAKGIPVSPALAKFASGVRLGVAVNSARKKKLTPKELLQQAHNNLQSGFYQSGFGGIPPNAGTRYKYTAVNNDGHSVSSNDGEKWVDTQTGAPIPQ